MGMDLKVDFAKELKQVELEERMKSSYLDYAMSVIVGRALPDVRDGLKPVHRRALFAMHEVKNFHNAPYKKSARIVGDVLGKYHPHAGEAVYDALVRLAQPFSLRSPLVDGQGNFGSIDGDNPAAMRYTEVRMNKITHHLLADIDKETVNFSPNYDGAEMEPDVLPAKFPNLLVNGSSGIAVGMATNIPPHNLGEIIDATLYLLANNDATVDDLQKIVPAPDFPTGAFISGLEGVREAYSTGKGRVVMRAKTHFEDLNKNKTKKAIIIDELPYQVNKAALITKIADLARDKKIEGISDLRDESDRQGIRVVIELRNNENEDVILNKLFKETPMQENFSINMVSLVDGSPKQLGIRDMLWYFLRHRREVVVRRAKYNLKKTKEQAHLLEGYAVAVTNIDEVVKTIKESPTPKIAEEKLLGRSWESKTVVDMLARLPFPTAALPDNEDKTKGMLKDGYWFTKTQVKAILDMRLGRLTGMERDKISKDYGEAVDKIIELIDFLNSPNKIDQLIKEELTEMKDLFSDPRRSIITEFDDIGGNVESLIAKEEMMVTFSHKGYVKRQPISDYQTQRRGGRGKKASDTREDDFISRLFVASTHDHLMLFTNMGRAYCKKVHELPLAARATRGNPIVGLLNLKNDEKVQTVLPIENINNGKAIILATKKGVVKKVSLSEFANTRSNGINAISLDEGDSLINASLIDEEGSVLMFTNKGKVCRFASNKLRSMGRAARGVRGMKINEDENIVSMLAIQKNEEEMSILVATNNGRGKRTNAKEFAIKGRGGKGMIALRLNDKNSELIGVTLAGDGDELMLITNGGVLSRINMGDIRKQGRNTQGFSLIKLDSGKQLVGIARIAETEEDEMDEAS